MDELFLTAPGMDYEQEILAYKAETLAVEPYINGVGGLNECATVPEWLALCKRKQRRETCPEGLVPDSTWLCVRKADDRLVGVVNIRHELNDFMLNYGGHIGYSIRPGERGKGYGKVQLRLALDKCRELGLEHVLLTCNESNERSRRTIEACGGLMEDVREKPDGSRMQRWWIDV